MNFGFIRKTPKKCKIFDAIQMFKGHHRKMIRFYQCTEHKPMPKEDFSSCKSGNQWKSSLISSQNDESMWCRKYTTSVPSTDRIRGTPKFIGGGQANKTFEYKKAKDGMDRLICKKCDFILYENPKIVVGSVVKTVSSECSEDLTKEVQYLLGKRTIQPRSGYWGLPAGYMEKGETVEDCARREALEECNAVIVPQGILAVYSIPHIAQVHIYVEANLQNPREIRAGEECDDVGLFTLDEIPYQDLAFPTGSWALYHSLLDRGSRPYGNPSIEDSTIHQSSKDSLSDFNLQEKNKEDQQKSNALDKSLTNINRKPLSIYDLWFNGKSLVYDPTWRLK